MTDLGMPRLPSGQGPVVIPSAISLSENILLSLLAALGSCSPASVTDFRELRASSCVAASFTGLAAGFWQMGIIT
jgi:hypothetical protein